MSNFVKFTHYGRKSRRTVTIRNNGFLYVPSGVMSKLNASGFRWAYIHIDEEKRILAVQFLENKPDDNNHRAVVIEPSGITIDINPVLKYFSLNKPEKKVLLDMEIKESMVVFSLDPCFKRPFGS